MNATLHSADGRLIRGLDDDQLRRQAPSVFASTPWAGMSKGYRFVPTIEVVNILRDNAYVPVRAEQSRCKLEGKGDFTRHLIRFRHSEYFPEPGRAIVGQEIPELVLINSHDGSSGYQLSAGIFRTVCTNGMVVQSSQLGSISIRHIGRSFRGLVNDATSEIAERVPNVLRQIEQWKQIDLTAPQRTIFAEAALEIRGGESRIEPREVLAVRRSMDSERDLWTTSNVAQENLLRGGMQTRSRNGRRGQTKAIKSVGEDVRINRALWTLTEKMAELVS